MQAPGHWTPGHWTPGHWTPGHWTPGHWTLGHWTAGAAPAIIRAMFEALDQLLAATALFVCAHFLLSSRALRAPLAARLGPQAFLGVYSLVVGIAFVWMLMAYGSAPYITLWTSPLWLHWLPATVMPVALLLAVCGLTTPSPTIVGGDRTILESGADPAPGMLRVTRHPFLWGVALWAVSHMVVNGDVKSLILMAGLLVLALGGMWHIDRRRAATLGAAWDPIALITSVLPFRAILEARTTPDWPAIGWWRPALALAIYLVLLALHETIFGVSAWPL